MAEAKRLDTSVDWNALLAPYRTPQVWRSLFQLVNTALPFVLLWVAMLWSLTVSYWLTMALAVPTALLLVRLFVIQHDCGHGSFFKSQHANNAIGFVIGIVTLVPYGYWRKTHAIHHATSGNLDTRTFGDIDTLTVREYLSLARVRRLLYRCYRHPVVLLVIGPLYQFVLKHRFPADTPRSWTREWASVHMTNIALVTVVAIMWLTVGWDRFLMIQLPITLLSGSVGVFLFYMQHQYEDTYWRYRETWDYYEAGLEGSSYFELPRLLQWFTANIGFHHIHHVSSRIPNYHLARCYRDIPALQNVTRLSVWESFKTLRLTLWDEDAKRLIGFRDLRTRQGEIPAPTSPTKPEAMPRAWRAPT